MCSAIHQSADVHSDAEISEGVSIWHLAQVRERASIGHDCVIGRGAYVGAGVTIGANCKVQNFALIYEPAQLGEGVFIGPSATLTNDTYPRAVSPNGAIKGPDSWEAKGVVVHDGASIGANATCVAPLTVGRWSVIGAGAVVTRDVPDFALVVGVPAQQIGWVGKAGIPLVELSPSQFQCPVTEEKFSLLNGKLVEEVGPS